MCVARAVSGVLIGLVEGGEGKHCWAVLDLPLVGSRGILMPDLGLWKHQVCFVGLPEIASTRHVCCNACALKVALHQDANLGL